VGNRCRAAFSGPAPIWWTGHHRSQPICLVAAAPLPRGEEEMWGDALPSRPASSGHGAPAAAAAAFSSVRSRRDQESRLELGAKRA
jgi:hypothetical protein